jgi:hypothetical protein
MHKNNCGRHPRAPAFVMGMMNSTCASVGTSRGSIDIHQAMRTGSTHRDWTNLHWVARAKAARATSGSNQALVGCVVAIR